MADEARGAGGRQERDKIGEVQIADEVVAIIAGLAASEVDGVDSMGSGFSGKLSSKNPGRGVEWAVTEEHVSVGLALSIKYGYSIPAVCSQVQEKVSAAIENMTGLVVLDVNIRVAGVNMNEG